MWSQQMKLLKYDRELISQNILCFCPLFKHSMEYKFTEEKLEINHAQGTWECNINLLWTLSPSDRLTWNTVDTKTSYSKRFVCLFLHNATSFRWLPLKITLLVWTQHTTARVEGLAQKLKLQNSVVSTSIIKLWTKCISNKVMKPFTFTAFQHFLTTSLYSPWTVSKPFGNMLVLLFSTSQLFTRKSPALLRNL